MKCAYRKRNCKKVGSSICRESENYFWIQGEIQREKFTKIYLDLASSNLEAIGALHNCGPPDSYSHLIRALLHSTRLEGNSNTNRSELRLPVRQISDVNKTATTSSLNKSRTGKTRIESKLFGIAMVNFCHVYIIARQVFLCISSWLES